MRILIFLFSFLASFFNGINVSDINTINIKKYRICSSKLKKDSKIVFLSDLHSHEFGMNNKNLISNINKINPDLIIIGGDLVTTKHSFNVDVMLDLIKELSKKYKIYYGIGNHEARLKWETGKHKISYDDLIMKIKNEGICVLDNNVAHINELGINLYGLNLPSTYYNKKHRFILSLNIIRKCFGKKYYKADNNNLNILLAHNAEYMDVYLKTRFDVVLSGHMHGGVMRLPKGFGFISPRFQLFKPYCWGIHRSGSKVGIISSGLAMHSVPLRMFNPAELTVVYLKRTK